MKINKKSSLVSCAIKCGERARRRMIIKYEESPSFYNVKVINDIIFNEESHFVATFKEYLIYEEVNEFFKRFYEMNESRIKIAKILQFYDKYSKIYPNYTQLPESKYIYKNIKRKQKMIDNMQNSENHEIDLSSNSSYISNIFDTKALKSIEDVSRSLLHQSNYKDNDEMNEAQVEVEIDEENLNNKILNKANDSATDIISVLTKIKKSEKAQELKQKDIICVNKKNINESNILSPKLQSKIFDIKGKLQEKHQNKLQQKNNILIAESILAKFEKMLLTTNSGISIRSRGIKTERFPSSSANKKLLTQIPTPNNSCKTRITSSSNNSKQKQNINNNINAYYDNSSCSCNSNQRKQMKQMTNNISNMTAAHISAITKSKLFSPRNSTKRMSPRTQNTSLERRSISIPKNSSILNNVNIINHIQPGSTQINIYNGNDLFKSLKLNSKNASNKSQNSQKDIKKYQPKFERNIRKLVYKNIMEAESATERGRPIDKCSMNVFQEIKHHKINSMGVSKINNTECKSISRVPNNSQIKNHIRQESLNKVRGIITHINHNTNINNNSISNNCSNNTSKLKMKNLFDIEKLLRNNNNIGAFVPNIQSDRHKMKKIIFK